MKHPHFLIQKGLKRKFFFLLNLFIALGSLLMAQTYHVDFNSTLTGNTGEDVFKAELNGDGKTDIVFYNPMNKTLTLKQNITAVGAGSLSFNTSSTIVLSATETLIAIEDFDGDNLADIIVRNDASTVEINVKLGPAFSNVTTFNTSLNLSNSYDIHLFNMDNVAPKDFYAIRNISGSTTEIVYIQNSGVSTNTSFYTVNNGNTAQFYKLNYSDINMEQILSFEKFSNACTTNSNYDINDIKVFDPMAANAQIWDLSMLGSNCGTGNWKLIPNQFTGDDYSDVAIYVPEDGTIYLLNNLGGSFVSLTAWQNGLSMPPGSAFQMDAGDYLQTNTNYSDMLLFQKTSPSVNSLGAVYVATNNQQNFFQLSAQMSQSGCYGNPVSTSGANWEILNGDFNGDGLLDISVYQNSNLLSFGLIDVINTTDPLNGYCWPQSADPGGDIKFYYSGQGNPVMKIYQYESRDNTVIETFKDDIIITPSISSSNQDVVTMGCGWTNTVTYTIPSTWESGYYAACLEDEYCKKNYVTFLVKSGSSISNKKVALIANTNTWAAYNAYNVGSSQSGTKYENNTNQSYSFMRPNDVSNPMAQITNRTRAELWIYTWLKDNGYDPDVIVDMDVHLNTNNFLNQYDFLIMGTHPEYWTGAMYGHVQAFQENGNNGNGGHLICLGGNAVFEACDINLIDPSNPKLIAYPNSPGGATEQLNAQYPLTDMPNVGGVAGPTNIVTTVYDRFDFFLESYNFGSNQTPVYKRSSDLIGTHYNIINNIIEDNGVIVNTTTSYNLDLTNPAISFLTNGISNNIIGDFGYNTGQFIVADGSGKASGWECERYSNATPPNIPGLNTPASPQPVTSIYDGFVEIVATGTTNNFTAPRLNFPNGLNYSEIIYVPQKCTSPKRGFVFTAGSITFGGSLVWNYNPTTQTYDNDVSKLLLNVLNHRTLQLVSANQPNCVNTATGSIEIQMGVTTPGINYNISPIVGNQFSPGHFSSLPAGAYQITATDANGCTLTTSVTLTDPPALNWSSITTTNPSCTPGNNGIIIPLTTGGTGQVSFTPSVLTGLNAGTYPITATDANGCSISTSVTLYQPNANHCCSATSNPNAGSNIASQPNIILLPNSQVSSLTANNLLANYGSGGVIQGKKFYIDGILTIDDNIMFNQCDIYFTTGSKITVNAGKNLHIVQNSTLQASCAMWDGIYASNASSQIHIDNSTLKDMENGIVSTIGAKLVIVGNQFIDNYSSLQIIQAPVGFNNTNGTCQIQGNTFSGSGNPLRAPHASQTKPELGIRLSKCSEVEIGVLGSTTVKNTFTQLYTGIFIEPGAQNQAHNLKIYNNLFENIKDDIQPGGAYYSTLIGNTYNTHRGAGIYAVPYSVAPLNITNLHRIVVNGNQNVVSFSNCDKAIVTSYFGANIQNIQTSGTPLGFMFGNADGQYIEAGNVISQLGGGQHNILNGVMIGIQVLGNTSKTFINDNEINLSGDYYQNGPINTLYYWAQGIVLRPFNAPSSPYQINQNQINIPNLGGTGISVSNAGKGLRLFNNEIHFRTTSAVPENSCAWCRAELVGIDMSNSRDGYLEANKVFGFVDAGGQPLVNVFNERSAYGIRMYHSRDVGLNCNETHKTRYGFYVVGDCSHADPLAVNGNVFDYHSSGMHFRHLGSEGTFGNIGDLNHDNNNQFANSAQPIGATQLREVWRITNGFFNDKIYTLQINQTQSGSTIGSQGAYQIQIPSQNHTLLSCEDLPVEIEEEGLSASEIQEALQIAGDSINYSEYTELSEWYDERQVYEWLRRDSAARATYPLLNAFYANQESLLTDEIRTLDANMDILCQENTLNDSTFFQNLIQEVTQENNTLPTGRLFENYEKDLNSIYFKVLTLGWQELTSADLEQLEELALSCPFVNGSAVYKSRSLYAHIQPGISYNDLEICNAAGVYKSGLGNSSDGNDDEESSNIIVYPNPTQSELQIYFPQSEGTVQIEIFDMASVQVLNMQKNLQNGKAILPVTSLTPGIYNIRIQQNHKVEYAKFIKN